METEYRQQSRQDDISTRCGVVADSYENCSYLQPMQEILFEVQELISPIRESFCG
jgi:hypothetical protein